MRRSAVLAGSKPVRGHLSGRTVLPEQGRSRRMTRRTPYRVPCRVRLIDPDTGEVRTITGQTVNISSGGLSVQIGLQPATGTWVETLVPRPTGEPMFVCGRVVHVRQTMTASFELGVETDSPSDFA